MRSTRQPWQTTRKIIWLSLLKGSANPWADDLDSRTQVRVGMIEHKYTKIDRIATRPAHTPSLIVQNGWNFQGFSHSMADFRKPIDVVGWGRIFRKGRGTLVKSLVCHGGHARAGTVEAVWFLK